MIEAHRREDETIMTDQETQEPMANTKKIVIENEDEERVQEAENKTSDIDADEGCDDIAPEEQPDLEEQLAQAQRESKQNHERMLRMAAEFENYKKRAAREMEDMRKYATENLLRHLLTVVDNLERAIASATPNGENEKGLVDGISLTLDDIMKLLEKHHVSPVAALGEPFDPLFHQAMCQEESEEHPPNTVLQEFQKGYLIHDRLLRPAMVVVSKAAHNGQSAENSVDTKA